MREGWPGLPQEIRLPRVAFSCLHETAVSKALFSLPGSHLTQKFPSE